MHLLALFGPIGTWEALVLLVLALLLFGGRLPQVARSLGRSLVEFRRGLHGIERDIEEAAAEEPSSLPRESATRPPLSGASAQEMRPPQDHSRPHAPGQVPESP